MIGGSTGLLRQLQAFFETSALPWGAVTFKCDRDHNGVAVFDDDRIEISFKHRDRDIDVYIIAPSLDRIDGVETFPHGKLAARCDDQVVKGPLDQSTWDAILKLIND